MQSHSEVKGQEVLMLFGQGVQLSSVGGTVGWSCESLVDIGLDFGEVKAKEMKTQEVIEDFLHPA